MEDLFSIFKLISETYGYTAAIGIILVAILLYGVYILIKNTAGALSKVIENKVKESSKIHSKGTLKRKTVSIEIRNNLSNLIKETNADRALLIEFSNGTSNLAGLPFLYCSASSEVIKPGVPSVSHLYQRINSSLIADFLVNLENEGYFYIEDIEFLKEEYPLLYSFMKPNRVKSALFYSIYGVNDTIGFIVVTSVKEPFKRKDVLCRIAETAQVISSFLNLEDLEEVVK